MRILIVEDDRKIASFLIRGLKQAGFAVDHASNGVDGLELALAEPYDVALIDRLRHDKVMTPVIILSAKRSVDDRVKGLHSGSDDYLTKPFALSELVARIHALLRRASAATEPTRLMVGPLVLDLLTRDVTRSGKRLELQSREFSLLEYLIRNAGRPVSQSMILQHVWSLDFDPQTNVVEVLVSRLRTKVDAEFPGKLIHTIRGVGYVLRAP